MKKLIVIFLSLVVGFPAFSQTSSDLSAGFQIGFVPPLSTNGRLAPQYSNGVSVNFLAGISRSERIFALSGLANVITQNATGFQLAGLVNYTGGNAKGFQLGGLGNYAGGHVRGFQLGGLGNLVSGDVQGFQLGGLANTARQMHGFQLGSLSNTAADATGVQVAGLFNKAGTFKGFQLGGIANVAGDVKGFQLGGLVNVAKNVRGVQFAGLVNIAQSSDAPLAMLNIIREGEYAVAATYNEMGNLVASLRSGGRYTYGILGVGYNHKTKKNGLVIEGGYGARIPVASWLRINAELKSGMVGNGSDDFTGYSNFAILPAFRLARHLEIFGGPSISYIYSENRNHDKIFPKHSLWKKFSTRRYRQVHIGWETGVQYVF